MRLSIVGLFFMLLFSGIGFSQDLTLKYGETVVNNDSLYFTGTKSTELIEIRLSVTNNWETAASIKVKKKEITLIEGAECSFCWGECYTPAVKISPMAITIQPGATDRNSFVGDYRPFEMEGTSIVKYTFFDTVDTTYQQSVTVFFQIGGSGVSNNLISSQPILMGPNPARELVRVFLPAEESGIHTVSLVNAYGQVVMSELFPAGMHEISIPVARIPAGVYYVRIVGENGPLKTGKLLITR